MKKHVLGIIAIVVFAIVISAIGTNIPFAEGNSDLGLDSGDIAWVATCSALVMLMTPAVGFFYGGLVRKKNLLSILAQSLVMFAIVSTIWALWGYSIAFGNSIGGIVGDLSHLFMKGVGYIPDAVYAATIPAALFFFFQLKFAAITPVLIIGAFAERIKFKSLIVFTVIWSTIVYAPLAHWVWGSGGWLRELGALDFAGGTVVHIAAGFSAVAAALVIGSRKGNGKMDEHLPNNIPFVILGASLLWFGWFGFNGGSALAANSIAINAIVVTNLAAAFAALSWMFYDWIKKGKPTATGIAIGAVCGLVAITPASGFVDSTAAIAIGAIAGLVSNIVAGWRAERKIFDDTLDVFACHGISGVWGAIATGIFARIAVNPAGANGLIYGNPNLLAVQIIAIIAAAAWSFGGSFAIMKVIDKTIGLRVTPKEEEDGLDVSQHGEQAYS